MALPPSLLPCCGPECQPAARTPPPQPARLPPAHLLSCTAGPLSTPLCQTMGTRGGARLLCLAHAPLPSCTLRHITGTLTHAHAHTHTEASIQSLFIQVFIEHVLRLDGQGLFWGPGLTADSNPDTCICPQGADILRREHPHCHTNAHTHLALTSLSPNSGQNPSPVPIVQWPSGCNNQHKDPLPHFLSIQPTTPTCSRALGPGSSEGRHYVLKGTLFSSSAHFWAHPFL